MLSNSLGHSWVIGIISKPEKVKLFYSIYFKILHTYVFLIIVIQYILNWIWEIINLLLSAQNLNLSLYQIRSISIVYNLNLWHCASIFIMLSNSKLRIQIVIIVNIILLCDS